MKKMNKKFEKELENSENWDFEHAEMTEPPKSPRTIVSVAFKNDDFKIVSKSANGLGKKISEFIREAALDKATGRSSSITFHTFASSGTLWCADNLPSSTLVRTPEIVPPAFEPITTY